MRAKSIFDHFSWQLFFTSTRFVVNNCHSKIDDFVKNQNCAVKVKSSKIKAREFRVIR